MKKKIAIVLIFVLFLGGIGVSVCWYFLGKKDNAEEIAVGKNQSLIIAQISTINGNEITYAVAEEVDFSNMGSRQKGEIFSKEENKDSQGNTTDTDSGSSDSQNISENEEKPRDMGGQNMPDNGEMPNDMGDRNMSGNGEMPSDMRGQNMTDKGEMPSDMGSGKMSSGSNDSENISSGKGNRNFEEGNSSKSKTMYTLTGEAVTTLIPVGTTVTTQLGATTTFSRLAAGDMVKLLMEKDEKGNDVIVGIWIVG